jgi:hypothetical protein
MRLVRNGMADGHPCQIFQLLKNWELEDNSVLASCIRHSPLPEEVGTVRRSWQLETISKPLVRAHAWHTEHALLPQDGTVFVGMAVTHCGATAAQRLAVAWAEALTQAAFALPVPVLSLASLHLCTYGLALLTAAAS